MKKYNYEEIKQQYKKQINIYEKQLYIIDVIQKDLKNNPKVYKNINKNIKEYIEKLFENEKYNFEVRYYSDNNDYYIRKDITFYDSDRFSYTIQLLQTNKHYNSIYENYIISIDSLEHLKNTINKWIEEKKETLKILKTNVNKFNKLMDKIEEIYSINDDFKYILEVKSW